MNRVLLADDPAFAAVVRQRAEERLWSFVVAPQDQHATWAEFGPCLSPAEAQIRWDTTPIAEVTLAATGDEMCLLASRALAAGATLIVLPDLQQTADWAYSLFPFFEDSPQRLRPEFGHRRAPAVQRMRTLLAATATSQERRLTCRCTLPVGVLSDTAIERRLFVDSDLFRSICGEYESLTAVPVRSPSGSVLTETVTLAGAGLPTVIWSIEAADRFSWMLTVQDGLGRATLEQTENGEWTCDAPPLIEVTHSDGEPSSNAASWRDVLRAFDYVAASRRSIRRRRTVDLQAEALSEKAQFKTLMSAAGCGLLLFTLMGVVGLLIAGAAFDPRDNLQRASEAAGLVFEDADFDPLVKYRPFALTADAGERLGSAIPRLRQAATPILLEATGHPQQDEGRRNMLVAELRQRGIENAEHAIELRPLEGLWFGRIMTLAWVLLFLPLGLFLAVQFLIFLTSEPTRSVPQNETR